MKRTRKIWLGWCVVGLAAGCGGEAPEEGAVDESRWDPEAALGGFVIDLVPARGDTPAHTGVLGKVYDGTVPAAIQWTTVEESGGCRLLTPRVPFCSPGCGGAAVCVEDGRCQPYPTPQNVGRVQVSGLGSAAFPMDPISGSYQPAAGVALPYPPFQEGATVALSAPGASAFPAFSVASRGIAPLEVAGSFALAAGSALPVAWTPAAAEGTRIEVKLDISHHGGTKGKIECETADDGGLEIPGGQIGQLLALGVAGFPTIVVTRVAEGSSATRRGHVSLRVTSGLELPVEVPGLRSCTAQEDCPTGQSCQADLSCK